MLADTVIQVFPVVNVWYRINMIVTQASILIGIGIQPCISIIHKNQVVRCLQKVQKVWLFSKECHAWFVGFFKCRFQSFYLVVFFILHILGLGEEQSKQQFKNKKWNLFHLSSLTLFNSYKEVYINFVNLLFMLFSEKNFKQGGLCFV